MNKHSLPAVLFAGLLLAGCSHPDSAELWNKGDVKNILKQQYGDTAIIVLSDGCNNGTDSQLGLPCPQLIAMAGKKGEAGTLYYFYAGPVPGLVQKTIAVSSSTLGKHTGYYVSTPYYNSDTAHRKQLVIASPAASLDIVQEEFHDQMGTAFGLTKSRVVIQDVQLEEVKQEERRDEPPPPPPPPPIMDSSIKKKPNKK